MKAQKEFPNKKNHNMPYSLRRSSNNLRTSQLTKRNSLINVEENSRININTRNKKEMSYCSKFWKKIKKNLILISTFTFMLYVYYIYIFVSL